MSYKGVDQRPTVEPPDDGIVTAEMLGSREPLVHFESVTVPSLITLSPWMRQLPVQLRKLVRRAMRAAH
ncbi:MAG TPA: hypothetical protein VG147_10665 [Solirubrobacteraceae bacterium]|jgi:hypothetical protein|nr:hypothetical protein [Solirubrobacteraceae bacterium]